jgi:hypothetical protein
MLLFFLFEPYVYVRKHGFEFAPLYLRIAKRQDQLRRAKDTPLRFTKEYAG